MNDFAQRWVTPALLAVVGATSFGGYQQATLSNEQLVALNASVGEQNRLAEMRGSTAAELKALHREVEKLRNTMDNKISETAFLAESRLVRTALEAMRRGVDSKAESAVVQEQGQANRQLILEISRNLDQYVTHQQLNTLTARVDAIGRLVKSRQSQ